MGGFREAPISSTGNELGLCGQEINRPGDGHGVRWRSLKHEVRSRQRRDAAESFESHKAIQYLGSFRTTLTIVHYVLDH